MGKKLVAARELEEGHVLLAEDVAIKSPADGGLPPYELESIVGRRLRRRLAPDENVELGDLEPVEEPDAAHAAPRP
jgi:sialic acid synthase